MALLITLITVALDLAEPAVIVERPMESLDRLCDGVPWGVGLLFAGRKRR